MIEKIIQWANGQTMYRSMLYYMISINGLAIVFSAIGFLPYNPLDILTTSIYLVIVCQITNTIFARLINTKANIESPIISALILSLIIGPLNLLSNIVFITVAAVAAMTSKYLVAWNRRHVFNPAAFGVVVTALLLGQSASWWVGNIYLQLFIVAGGLYMVKKIRRFPVVWSFLATYLVLLGFIGLFRGDIAHAMNQIWRALIYSPILFFTFVMLIEPLTSPVKRRLMVYYGSLTAIVLLFNQYFGDSLPYSLELSLLVGNLFSRVLSPATRYKLKLEKRQDLTSSIGAFFFSSLEKIPFVAGQYLEWTLAHPHSDSRGIRRYFTVASSPTEKEILLTTRFAEKSSSYKRALQAMKPGDELIVSCAEGEFTLPKDMTQPLVFIAGGIGITPFRSMIKYLIDKNEKRPITLFYSNRSKDDIVFKDLFDDAEKKIGLKTVYTITDDIPANWRGETGYVDETMIKAKVTDWQNRTYYVSGPDPMVEAFGKLLRGLGIRRSRIRHDFFPGYTETYQAKH